MSELSISFKECLDRAKKEFDDIEKRKLRPKHIGQRPIRNIEKNFINGIKNNGKS